MKYFVSRSFLLFIIFLTSSTIYSQHGYLGIPSERLKTIYAEEKATPWSWAASVQIILQYYGIDVEQSVILARSYRQNPFGEDLLELENSLFMVTENLNGWSITRNGVGYKVQAELHTGLPSFGFMLNEMRRQSPILIAYEDESSLTTAMVIFGIDTLLSESSSSVRSVLLRDPWPNYINRTGGGAKWVSGRGIGSRVKAYWDIRAFRED